MSPLCSCACRLGETPRPVALVQLAAQLGCGAVRCYLLHIAAAGLTPSLRSILCSPVRTQWVLPPSEQGRPPAWHHGHTKQVACACTCPPKTALACIAQFAAHMHYCSSQAWRS